MDRDAGKAVQANLKRITVPVYSTDPSRHLDYHSVSKVFVLWAV